MSGNSYVEKIFNQEDYEHEFGRVVSDSEEFSYDDDGFDYDNEEREEVATLEEEYRSWWENEMSNT